MALSIAVAISAYNAEPYIVETLDSIARQTRQPDQIIVVDDGSTDGTARIVREWADRTGLKVDLLQQANRGLPAGRNRGIRHASTDLVALQDADDLFLPHHLDLLSRGFEQAKDAVLCYGDGETFTSDGVVNPSILRGSAVESLGFDAGADGLRLYRGSAYTSLLEACYVPVGATVLRKSAAESIGLYDEFFRMADDREFYLRLSRVGPFAGYRVVVFRKRVHTENLTHAKHRALYRRYQMLVLQKMLRHAGALRLTSEEIRDTRKALDEQAWGMVYHASERGLLAFLDTCRFLAQRGVIRPLTTPRHWLRAVAFSTVLEKRFR